MLKQYWLVETMEVNESGAFLHKFHGKEGFEGIDITPERIREYGYETKSDAIRKMNFIDDYIKINHHKCIVSMTMYYAYEVLQCTTSSYS